MAISAGFKVRELTFGRGIAGDWCWLPRLVRSEMDRCCSGPFFGGLFAIPPPDGGKCRATILGQWIVPTEAVPTRRAQLVISEQRHDVVVPQQHAVERPGGRHQLAAALGENH